MVQTLDHPKLTGTFSRTRLRGPFRPDPKQPVLHYLHRRGVGAKSLITSDYDVYRDFPSRLRSKVRGKADLLVILCASPTLLTPIENETLSRLNESIRLTMRVW